MEYNQNYFSTQSQIYFIYFILFNGNAHYFLLISYKGFHYIISKIVQMERMKNTTLQHLVKKYSSQPNNQDSLILSKVSRVVPTDKKILTPSRITYNMCESYIQAPKIRINGPCHDPSLSKIKQDCQEYLFKIREQIIEQKMQLNQCPQKFISIIMKKIVEQHENLKSRVLKMIDGLFKQQYKRIQRELSHAYFSEQCDLSSINQHYNILENKLEESVRGLRSQNYRNTISEVALHNYNRDLSRLKEEREKIENQLIGREGKYIVDEQKIEKLEKYFRQLWRNEKEIFRRKQPQYLPQIETSEKQGICSIFS